jgi:hypothetical protein
MKNCVIINREINSLTKIEKEIIKNLFNLMHSLNGSIIKIRVEKLVYYLKNMGSRHMSQF